MHSSIKPSSTDPDKGMMQRQVLFLRSVMTMIMQCDKGILTVSKSLLEFFFG